MPIQFDASCNGFQHLTLLIDDVALSKELNLSKSNPNDIPSDFYTYVSLKIKDFFQTKLTENRLGFSDLSLEDKESFKTLANLDIHRSLIKKAVMTIPYNASPSSITEYIKESFNKEIRIITNVGNKTKESYYIHKDNPNIIFKDIDFKNLRKALNVVIFLDYPKLTALSLYLKNIAKVANILNIPVPWILPSGLEIKQQYYAKETIRVKPYTYNKNTFNFTILNKKEFNTNKQKIALMPNLVHSLDAASLCLVIINYFKYSNNNQFYAIHDCFAVPCNKVNILFETLKSAYCIIYSKNKYLLEFDSNFRNMIIKTYGEKFVTFNDKEGILNINTTEDIINIKYPSVHSVISGDIQKIDISNSTYLIN